MIERRALRAAMRAKMFQPSDSQAETYAGRRLSINQRVAAAAAAARQTDRQTDRHAADNTRLPPWTRQALQVATVMVATARIYAAARIDPSYSSGGANMQPI